MEKPGDTQAIPCVVAANAAELAPAQRETHDALFEAARARIDAIAGEWAEVLNAFGAVVGPPAEQLTSPTRIQGPMATAPILL